MSSSDRALISAFREITSMADRIHLPKTIVDCANNLFKEVHDGKNLKGRAIDAIASACLYTVCRLEGVPRTFKVCWLSKRSQFFSWFQYSLTHSYLVHNPHSSHLITSIGVSNCVYSMLIHICCVLHYTEVLFFHCDQSDFWVVSFKTSDFHLWWQKLPFCVINCTI
jgi:hypothetical protein